MDAVKIQLSPKEREMVQDPDIILTKNSAIKSIIEMFGAISRYETDYINENRLRLPPEVSKQSPKISRGEQYRELPWVMLDFPRVFDPGATLAIRHLFWWGNFFSVTIQVSGKFKDKVVKNIERSPQGTHLCVHPSPWEHHFGSDNYRLLAELQPTEFTRIAEINEYVKLALVLPVANYELAPSFLLKGFSSWMDLLKD